MTEFEQLIDTEFFQSIFKKSSGQKRYGFKYKAIALEEFIKFCNEYHLTFKKRCSFANIKKLKRKFNNPILFNLLHMMYHFLFSRYVVSEKISSFDGELNLMKAYEE